MEFITRNSTQAIRVALRALCEETEWRAYKERFAPAPTEGLRGGIVLCCLIWHLAKLVFSGLRATQEDKVFGGYHAVYLFLTTVVPGFIYAKYSLRHSASQRLASFW